MASTRRSPPAEADSAVDIAVAAALDRHLRAGDTLLVALSGGRDSIALADALARLAPARGVVLAAMHVHHGLSAHADEWAAFCASWCESRAIPFTLARVDIGTARSSSVEAAAREMRYRALASHAAALAARAVALAHHADDQAETLILQLARGAGPQGLASMHEWHASRGTAWLRPLLGVTRASIDEACAARTLDFVDDDSNASHRHRRNALRHDVVPALRALAPGYPLTFARSAALAGEAAELLDALAAMDAAGAADARSLVVARLRELAPARARNLLRWFLRQQGLAMPSQARLETMLAQFTHAAVDARVDLPHDGRVLALHRGRVMVHAPPPSPYALDWRGEDMLALPHGTLRFDRGTSGAGAAGEVDAPRLAIEALDGAPWSVRSRRGGERFAPFAAGTERRLKSLLQHARMPPWERAGLPLVFRGERLAAVPGIGVDAAFRAAPGAPGVVLGWQPA